MSPGPGLSVCPAALGDCLLSVGKWYSTNQQEERKRRGLKSHSLLSNVAALYGAGSGYVLGFFWVSTSDLPDRYVVPHVIINDVRTSIVSEAQLCFSLARKEMVGMLLGKPFLDVFPRSPLPAVMVDLFPCKGNSLRECVYEWKQRTPRSGRFPMLCVLLEIFTCRSCNLSMPYR